MTDEPLTRPGTLDPDVTEEELAPELDNVVPTYGYHKLRVVGLGGSAGSIPALQRFFEKMPPDTGMAFVVVVHLSPDHDSVLSDILQRSTAMPVSTAGDGTAVAPNHVYVIPPGKHITMSDGHMNLNELPKERGRRMTVDLFFRSLADSHGPNAVAIVLSGGDGDGAIGIKRVKERGGLTIAQDPEAADHAGMPEAAIATSMVDWVLRGEEMPARLVEYHMRGQRLRLPAETGPNPVLVARPPVSKDEEALRDVLTFLRARTGRDFSYYKRATIVRRIARRMQVNEVDQLPDYLTFLRTHPGEAGALLQDVLISVTNFFRDREAFEALEAQVPELFKNKSPSDTVRVWVPACATGEEAYSIAMLLTEHARSLDTPPAVQVFATDLDEDVLTEARNGVYPSAISTDVSADRLRRFFIKEHQGYRVRRELRELLLFAVHDLLKDSPFSRLDMVSCRNLLIYLNRDAQQRVFDIFHFALRPEGRLFLGTSEAVEDASNHFYPIDKKHRIYKARGAARSALPVPSGPSTLARALALQERNDPMASLAVRGTPVVSAGNRPSLQERLSWNDLHLKLVERLGPPSLIVSDDQEVLHLSQHVGPFLQFSGGEPSMNLLRIVHPMLRLELRAALFRARQSQQPAVAEGVSLLIDGEHKLVDMRVVPAPELAADILLVTFEVRAQAAAPPPAPRPQEEPVLQQLERELEQTRRHLRDTIEQHEASTEELKASNEELQAMNEELRSATEELETSREELQSINEELTTVNHELKGKVDELGHSNSDLHNLMGATAIATIFLDRELRIMRFTPPAVSLFSFIPTDIGRPLADLQHRLSYPELLPDAERVLQQLVPIEREVPEQGGRHFLARLLPYRTTDDRIAGAVLTFVDITERHQAQEALRQARQDLEQRVQERTAELDQVNQQLRREVANHQRAERSRQDLQRRMVNAQEEERSRISRELHDEVGQQIAALLLSLKSLEIDGASPAFEESLQNIRSTAEGMAKEIHQLAFELRPVALDQMGLVRAVAGLLEGWQSRSGIKVDFVSAGLERGRLPHQVETTLYRIVQEAMTNVHKHSAAQTVSVSIERRGGQVITIVEDDGKGFDPEEATEESRIGLIGMRERASIVGGELTIESTRGNGTTVRVKVPLPAMA
jgi:two-component system, chemotaxis family, CheB/CheR fusion protein